MAALTGDPTLLGMAAASQQAAAAAKAATKTAPLPPAPKPPGGAAAAAAANKSKRPLLPPEELFVVSSTYPLQLNSPQRAVVLSALTDLSKQYFVFEGKEITPARPADFAKMTYKRVCVCVCVCGCVCGCGCVHSHKNLYSGFIVLVLGH